MNLSSRERVLEILAILQRVGEIKSLKLERVFLVSRRTIQEDIKYIRNFLGDELVCENNIYKLKNRDALTIFSDKNYTKIHKFLHVLSTIDSSLIDFDYSLELIMNDYRNTNKTYLFLENSYEDLSKNQQEYIEKLEDFIMEKKYIHITYKIEDNEEVFIYRYCKPWKIVCGNGNWYLAVTTSMNLDEINGFRLLRILYITTIIEPKVDPYNFKYDVEVELFLKNDLQTLFSSFVNERYKVKVKVSSKIAHLFKAKRFLKSQRDMPITPEFMKEHDFCNGDILVEYIITNDMEIIPIIQTFLPHVRVIEPKALNDKILGNIQAYV